MRKLYFRASHTVLGATINSPEFNQETHIMQDNRIINEFVERLAAILPRAQELSGDLRTKIEQQLKKGFAELDLMTRAEFDAQAQALARAEARIDDLETSLTEFERKLAAYEGASPE